MVLALNPSIPSYATRTTYVSIDEYIAAPTALDLSQLVSGGSDSEQRQALLGVMQRASGMADTFCRKIFAATRDTQSGWYMQRIYSGSPFVTVIAPNTPVIDLVSAEIGFNPVNAKLSPIVFGENVSFDNNTITIPMSSLGQGRMFVKFTYTNGYAHTQLVANAEPGDTSITVGGPVDGPYGVNAGLQLTIYQGPKLEVVTVADTYTGGHTIPLTTPLLGSFSPSTPPSQTTVSALPPDVRQAVIAIATAIIKSRGDSGISLIDMGAPRGTRSNAKNFNPDLEEAHQALLPYRRGI